ncbi:uncharacterized protein LOC121416351 isoform X2 [Lytechinus variegatus]|uniref:uncharacterized protein LOC121416351 isoform X1 n=1 Tax=Lytechinus variegatus TaxID=7654 RepID=UPI001BB0DA65|nr:uncharacterized protein LOC121416351 isoform X1 [Lytechinus variegatus]XP_041465856.1 uncharacterized protein LOC121416351 isoform X2 [Lytechinus variegatus]
MHVGSDCALLSYAHSLHLTNMVSSTPKWLLVGGFLIATLATISYREAWAEGIRAVDAMEAINSGRQQFLQGLRGALAAVAAQKDNLVEELLADVEDEEEDVVEKIEEELGVLDPPNVKTVEIRLPNADIPETGTTLCTSTSLTEALQDIVGFSPLINQDAVIHMELYGCPDEAASTKDYWSCNTKNTSGICQGPIAMMFQWSRDRCDNYLAMGDAITVGGAFMHNVVLMVQYKKGGFADDSGLALKIMPSSDEDKGVIKAVEYYSEALKNPKCETESSQSNELDNELNNELDNDVALSSSSSLAIEEPIGSEYSTADYLQSILEANSEWMSSSEPRLDYGVDGSVMQSSYQYNEGSYIDNALNENSDYSHSSDWAMKLQELWDSASALAYGMILRGWWPREDDRVIGQVAGVDTDSTGQLSLLHRGDRRWGNGDFDEDDKFLLEEPISDELVLTLDPATGNVLNSWGSDIFYMPHGLYIDTEDNKWITDVALHQVFKFSPGSKEPSMTLGKAFEPGQDWNHFCKPTDVAVDSRTGDVYVADGYCNNRILKFSSNGTALLEITAGIIPGENLPEWSPLRKLQIPHSLALIEARDIICVADRENARIQCFNLTNGELERQIASPMFGKQLFAISYNSEQDVLYTVNGPNEEVGVPPLAFTVDLETGEILSTWDPYPKAFGVVHDIATYSPDGSVYMADIGLDRVWKFETTSSSLSNEI